MDIDEIFWHICDIANTDVFYFKTDPEIIDFNSSAKIVIFGGSKKISFDIDGNNILNIDGRLRETIFSADKTVLCWNIKSYISFLRFYFQKSLSLRFPSRKASIIDLQTIEKFLGISKKAPENMIEAINRSRTISRNGSWKSIYKKIHLPLLMEVLPILETTPLLDVKDRVSKHAHYQVEGQQNGRLLCSGKFKKSYNPHILKPEHKEALKPRGYNQLFVYADFRHCEVSVLQWLSKDKKLKEIMDSGKDLYEEIYLILTGEECKDKATRDKCKILFLPVMYGCGAATLAKMLKISEELAKELINRIHSNFPMASAWMQNVQNSAKNKTITDYFGRPRNFENKIYLARNFAVQSVAATVCLEKLIDLYEECRRKDDINVAFSIHDGFGLICGVDSAKAAFNLCKSILESESLLCPGLGLNVEIQFGNKLSNLKTFWR